MKCLKEDLDNENDLARRIREVEEVMRKNEVTIDSYSNLFVQVKDKRFRVTNHGTIPRLTEDEKLALV